MRQSSGNSARRRRRSAAVSCRATTSASTMRARKAVWPSLSVPACRRWSSRFCAACRRARRRRLSTNRSLSSLAIVVVILLFIFVLLVVGARCLGWIEQLAVSIDRTLMDAGPAEILLELLGTVGLALQRAGLRLGGLAGDDAQDGVVIEGAIPGGVAQGLGDAGDTYLVGELEDLAHVVARGPAVVFHEALGDGLELLELAREDVPAGALRSKLGLVLGGDVALVLRVPQRVLGEGLPFEHNGELAVEHAHVDGTRDEAGRHRVTVGLVRHTEVVADEPHHHHAGLEAMVRQRDERRLLFHEAGRGLLVRRAVHAGARRLDEPFHGLPVEIVEIVKRPAREEVALHIAEGVFDLALSLLVPRRGRDGAEAVVLHQTLEEPVVDHAVLVALDDHLFHAVIQDLVRHAIRILEGEDVAVADGMDVGVEDEVDVLPAAVSEHEREADDGRGHTGQEHRVRGEVHLTLDAGRRLEAQVRPSHPLRSEGEDPRLDDGVAADIAVMIPHVLPPKSASERRVAGAGCARWAGGKRVARGPQRGGRGSGWGAG